MPRDKTGHFYFAWYPTIYQQDTQRLTLAEDGAYRRLIDHYMLTRAALPNCDIALARITGCSRDEWFAVRENVVNYFKIDGDKLVHNFCETELQTDKTRIIKARQNGAKGGRPKKRLSHSNKREITQPVSEVKPNPLTRTTKPEPPTIPIQPLKEDNLPVEEGMAGFSKMNGLVGSGSRLNGWRFIPSDDTAERIISIAPGWNLQMLMEHYKNYTREHGKPDYPQAAFLKWASNFTKGKPPR